jgi:hypothetical protein
MRRLGHSLGDVANFMNETEVLFGLQARPGKDARGIERLREVAADMMNIRYHGKVEAIRYGVSVLYPP